MVASLSLLPASLRTTETALSSTQSPYHLPVPTIKTIATSTYVVDPRVISVNNRPIAHQLVSVVLGLRASELILCCIVLYEACNMYEVDILMT